MSLTAEQAAALDVMCPSAQGVAIGTELKRIGDLTTAMSLAELAVLDGVTPGTQAASKAVVADANVNTGVSKVTELHVGATGSEVQVTATPAELNKNDVSAQAETITEAGAISVLVKNTKLDSTGGTFAATLAAPDASMYGLVKTIEMITDNGDVTLALTNVQGGSAATTATFADVNDCLMLVAGTSKWHVIGESGVTLS